MLVTPKGNFTLNACAQGFLSLQAAVIFLMCMGITMFGGEAVELYNAMALFNHRFYITRGFDNRI